MSLVKIAELYPSYKDDVFGGEDIKEFSVYSDKEEKIGSIYDVLVDEDGRFRYIIVNAEIVDSGKKVFVPVDLANIDYDRDRIYVNGFTKDKAEKLPEYSENMNVDNRYEQQVNDIYQDKSSGANREQMNDAERQTLKLYEERLVANKNRFRSGMVTLGKRVESETARIAIPIEKEQLIIEQKNATEMKPVSPDEADFRGGEVFRMEVFEESANIQKQTFIRGEVNIKKQIKHDIVEAQETVRREELEVDTEGHPMVHQDR
jgi:uncharacterized protein (TIGR02271 family)